MGKGIGSGLGFGKASGSDKGKMERFWIPAFPLPVAIICCVFNFLIPGFGKLEYEHHKHHNQSSVRPVRSASLKL